MSNMQEGKERAWAQFAEENNFVNRKHWSAFECAFDAGIKAERERVKNLMIKLFGSSAMPFDIDKEYFPDQQEQRSE